MSDRVRLSDSDTPIGHLPPSAFPLPPSKVPDLAAKLASTVRTLQIIVLAMVVVPLIFAGVVLVIGSQAPVDPAPIQGEVVAPRQGGETMGRVAMGFGLIALVVQQWMGRYVTSQAVENLRHHAMQSPERLAEALLTGTVVSCAICEGAAFLNLIAYMASEASLNLWMGLLLVASNASKFPTMGRVLAWTEKTMEKVAGRQ